MQDTWPAVPFSEGTPVCGAVAPLVSMFRHRDVLVQGCTVWAGRPMAHTAVGASVLGFSCLTIPSTPTAQGPELEGWSVPQGKPKHGPWAQQFWSESTLCWAKLRQDHLSQIHPQPSGTGAHCPQSRGCTGLEKGQPLPPKERGGEKNRRCEDWVCLWAFDPILTRNR